MAAQSVLIKKYENRRLYDATNSRYVNLDEVAQLVQQGYDVQVVDAASGEDITRLILTQIIAEGAKTADSNFPLDILRQMVIASGRASQESAIRYTKAMLDLYQSTYRAMAPALNPFDFMQNPLGAAAAHPAAAETQAPQAAGGAEAQEMSELKKRIAELEKVVSMMGKPATQGKPGTPAPSRPAPRSPAKRPPGRAPARKK
ncbi:MAG TPA: polyhydroxyalkanoate synthesis regulator DNA-binding domain-containing protein [Terracidiphilus sp.]|jgi:polyhydroxyalkanoate synthesis repressor PhaR|nr:polyhydroxyalkanoate synthesis regulator DNA-binding domain-containing protein [Terracidiphilus sp.]